MKLKTTLILLCLAASNLFAQEAIVDEWILNTTGKTASYWENTGMNLFDFHTSTTLADVLTVCYDDDYVYVESEGMTNDMGQFTNPGVPTAQGFGFKFPRNPTAGSGSEEAPDVAGIGVLINGIMMFGLSDGTSYDSGSNSNSQMGQGVWVGDAYWSEGKTLDTAFAAHPQQAGIYHSHATPFRLYEDPGSSHSPIVGFANDGYPVYGPFGYTSAMDSTSGTSRMVSGYELRNITNRTTLPDGTTSSAGPAVTTNGNFDLGTYIQDYEYVGGASSTLDEHNGRLCVTPEYPNGTYAYFVTVDAAGTPQFPYYVGTTYYGTPVDDNSHGSVTTPTSGVTCLDGTTNGIRKNEFLKGSIEVYPNPAKNIINITLPEIAKGSFDVKIMDANGRLVYVEYMLSSAETITLKLDRLKIPTGLYNIRIIGYNQLFTSKFVKQ